MSTSTPQLCPTHFKQAIYDAHTRVRDRFWSPDGQFIWDDDHGPGGFRGSMMHVLAYFHSNDPKAIDLGNRIVHMQNQNEPCHFAPSLVLEILYDHKDKLEPAIHDELIGYLNNQMGYMTTDDLQCHGYNDNHPHKAEHALILAGQLLDNQDWIDCGKLKLQQAFTTFSRNDFPSEYNSPNYLPVSLKPLAELVMHCQDDSTREMALWLERFHWNDLAEHFDARVGLPAGPFSRGYAGDYRGMLNNTVQLLSGLFPDRFDFDVIEELYNKQENSRLIDPSEIARLPFYQSHLIWYITPDYHIQEKTIKRIFADKSGQTVSGHIESGVVSSNCDLIGAPETHVMGPRQGTITTHYGKHYSLGTAQYSWLNGVQSHNMVACVHKDQKVSPEAAANYYTRMFYDENAPLLPDQLNTHNFNEQGECRTVQHRNAAMVFYNPLPFTNPVKRIRTGIFRPMWFTRPKAIFVGDIPVGPRNMIGKKLAPITIDEGDCYIGITPLRLTSMAQARHAEMEIFQDRNELAILISSFEQWGPVELTYNQVLHTHAGFVIEVQDASDWPSFSAYRQSLQEAVVEDDEYALMRRTRYVHHGIELSASYCPAHSMFRFSTGCDV